MKKFLFWATFVVCSVVFLGCNKGGDPSTDAEVNRVKAAAVGAWQGQVQLLGGDPRNVVVTFTEASVSTNEGVSQKIVKWYAVGNDVYADLDDAMKTSLNVKVNGGDMNLAGNSTFFLANFPSKLTRVVK